MMLGHRDTKNADRLGHRDIKNADNLGHRDTEIVDRQTLFYSRLLFEAFFQFGTPKIRTKMALLG